MKVMFMENIIGLISNEKLYGDVTNKKTITGSIDSDNYLFGTIDSTGGISGVISNDGYISGTIENAKDNITCYISVENKTFEEPLYTYSPELDKYYIKIEDKLFEVSALYQNEDDVWKRQTDLTAIFNIDEDYILDN